MFLRFARSISTTFISQLAASILLLVIGIITSRKLGVEGRGIYSLFFTSTGLVGTAIACGMGPATVYFLNKTKISIQQTISTLLTYFILLSVLFGIILLFGQRFISAHFFHHAHVSLSFYCAVIFFIADALIAGIALGSHKYSLYSVNLVLQASLILLFTLPLFFLTLSAGQVVWLRVIGLAFALFIYCFLVLNTQQAFRITLSFTHLKDFFDFGRKNFLQNVIGLLNYRVYVYFLFMFHGAKAVGLFSVALLLVESIRLLPNAVGTVLLPKLTQFNKHDDLKYFTLLTVKFTQLILIFGIITIMLLSRYLILLLFGKTYLPALMAFNIMALSAWFGSIYQLITRYFTALHLQQYSIACGIIALAFALISSISLIPNFGLLGAAYAFFIGNMSAGICMFICFKRHAKIDKWSDFLPSKTDLQLLRNQPLLD